MKIIVLCFLTCIISTTHGQQKEIFYIDLYTNIPKSSQNPKGPNEKYIGNLLADTNIRKQFDLIVQSERPDKKNWVAFIFQNVNTVISYNDVTYEDSCEILSSPYIIKIVPGLYKENYIICNGQIKINRKKGIIYFDNIIVLLDIYKKT